MKKIYYILSSALCAGLLFNSCTKEVEVDYSNEDAYANVTSLVGTLRDGKTNKVSNPIEIRKSDYNTSVAFNVSRAPKEGIDVTVAYDAEYLAAYNKEHGTSFALYPSDRVAIQNQGKILVAPDEKVSYSLDLTIAKGDTTTLENGTTYVIPLKASVKAKDVSMSSEDSHCVYLVKNLAGESDTFKGDGAVKTFLFYEANDTNPLNTLNLKLTSGELFLDYIVLFAANINYDAQKGEVYVYFNPNIQHLLDNNDVYLQPLRKRGVKVIMGILGNHDESGLAQLSKIGAQQFAKKLADMCYSYNLDGVNFDDEYSNAPDLSNPLFSYEGHPGARLMYETKRAMPDKEVTVYLYGNMYGVGVIDGIPASEWIDIAVPDYGGSAYPVGGMTLKDCAGAAVQLDYGAGSNRKSEAQNVKSKGYGYFMMFAPFAGSIYDSKIKQQVYTMSTISEGLYGVGLQDMTEFYEKGSATPRKLR